MAPNTVLFLMVTQPHIYLQGFLLVADLTTYKQSYRYFITVFPKYQANRMCKSIVLIYSLNSCRWFPRWKPHNLEKFTFKNQIFANFDKAGKQCKAFDDAYN